MFEGRISGSYCEIGDYSEIARVVADYTHSNIVYIMTKNNDIIVIELKLMNEGSSKTDGINCKSKKIKYLTQYRFGPPSSD